MICGRENLWPVLFSGFSQNPFIVLGAAIKKYSPPGLPDDTLDTYLKFLYFLVHPFKFGEG